MPITLTREDNLHVSDLIRRCLADPATPVPQAIYFHTLLARMESDGKLTLPAVGNAVAHLFEVMGGAEGVESFDAALQRLTRTLLLSGDLEGARAVERAARVMIGPSLPAEAAHGLASLTGAPSPAHGAAHRPVEGNTVVEEGDASGIAWHLPDAEVKPLILSADLRPPMERLIRDLRGIARYVDRGIKAPTRVLMVGPPGVGKTTAAVWIARQLGLKLAVVQLAGVVSSYRSRTQKNLAAILKVVAAEKAAVFFDEWDALASRRDASGPGTSEEAKHIMGAMLQLLSDHPSALLVMAATNIEGALDPAQKRRMPTRLVFTYPDLGARRELLALFWAKVDAEEEARAELLRRSDGRSGDWLEVVAHAAARAALSEDGDGLIRLPHVQQAANETPVQDELAAPGRARTTPSGLVLV